MKRRRGFARIDRINELVKRELALIVKNECKDPRIGSVTISDVKVTSDLSIAKVYFTIFEQNKIEDSIKFLQQASGFLRSELAKKVHLRAIPKIEFIYDSSLEEANRMSNLIDSLNVSKDELDENNEDESSDENN